MFESLRTWWSGSSTAPVSAPNPNSKTTNPLNPQGLKPCCACPETKRARDECYMKTDPESADEKCRELVAAHVKCMRGYGFEI
ncbi:cytochrome c oxidase copper chaperone [Pyrrhoderma noxium]|uniref:Cytochrome c oxidase copper chaperone n=1 Tax=Pyrrhoderma noxium TaxID=2282107 RepID=A0A286UV70_9AGAM|nr:cytochrome c oxidase copper chaperone [Pyrrhoderma noxium]